MNLDQQLAGVQNDRIAFATMRPPDSPFAVLDRRVTVTGPPDLVALAHTGEPEVVERLIALLDDPERNWAAEVMLAAMTGHEADLVASFAASPEAWPAASGETARARWEAWWRNHGARLVWDPAHHRFTTG